METNEISSLMEKWGQQIDRKQTKKYENQLKIYFHLPYKQTSICA